jgi:hypothetical protein
MVMANRREDAVVGDLATKDISFEATGDWTEVAFETTSESIPVGQDFGVSVVGSKCGVYGQGTTGAQLHRKIVPQGTGVIGRGDVHGVYGIGSTVTEAETPDFSLGVQPIGVVGVSDATKGGDAPAIFGDNNINSSDINGPSPASSDIKKVVTEGLAVAAGVEGISYSGFGLLGVSLNLNPDKTKPFASSSVPPNIHHTAHGIIHDAIEPDPKPPLTQTQPAGVLGMSVQGAGIRGVSRLDRGGIFESATGRYDETKGPQGGVTGPPVAQIRLVPHRVLEADDPEHPHLPAEGKTGDLMAVVVRGPNITYDSASLWFCVRGQTDAGDPTSVAIWRLINLTTTIVGKPGVS